MCGVMIYFSGQKSRVIFGFVFVFELTRPFASHVVGQNYCDGCPVCLMAETTSFDVRATELAVLYFSSQTL